MIDTIKKLWSPGVDENPLRLRRQIALCNQVGLFGTVATLPYQLFYYFYDFATYWGVFLVNLLFMAGYLLVLPLNHRRLHSVASNVLLINGGAQLFVVTAFIGTEAGVNLFYFTLASILVFLYQHLRVQTYAFVMALFGAQYALSHFLFTREAVISPVPSPWVDIMYAGSVVGVLMLSGALLYLFRQQIDHAEDELTLSNQYLETLSNTDPLTGLANRRALDAALEREWSRLSRLSSGLAVIMCDVDHFKGFNDRYGHDGGDRCLQRITTALEGVLSRPADLAVRYGGEEFALVLPGTEEAGARLLAERLREAVERLQIPNEAAGEGACVTVSVGVSSINHVFPEVGFHGVDHLIKRADEALYQAKASGRNRVVYLAYSDRFDVDGSEQ
ncbi:GGDEF domain-containing protein [Salinicola halophilus]|uniref:GGDEF domain-containing protein n=1 Tax=Salinicola halophilus TaxID=184065 RepID=UPI0013A647DA|nr:diguanylate cyclase [Salinicola halophilus]